MGLLDLFKKNADYDLDDIIVPKHIAIVMDGNGRWAKKRGLARTVGHKFGSETFRKIATYAKDIGVKYLTVYAFSTENWKRPQEEVKKIMELLEEYLEEAAQTMQKKGVGIRILGDLSALSEKLQIKIAQIHKITEDMDAKIIANLCVNYGGRNEICYAMKKIAKQIEDGKLSSEDINDELISRNLYTHEMPDPDLVIRPSGEIRLSNYLLWQSAYSEFYFTDVLWPDFDEKELDTAIIEFNKRNRRFGGV